LYKPSIDRKQGITADEDGSYEIDMKKEKMETILETECNI